MGRLLRITTMTDHYTIHPPALFCDGWIQKFYHHGNSSTAYRHLWSTSKYTSITRPYSAEALQHSIYLVAVHGHAAAIHRSAASDWQHKAEDSIASRKRRIPIRIVSIETHGTEKLPSDMATTVAPPFSHTPLLTSIVAKTTTTPTPLTILVHSVVEGTSDFFPFHDLAKVGGYTKDDVTFQTLIQEGIDGGDEIGLYLSGCLVNGVPDCPAACNDTTLYFGSFETFYNCAALASIVYWTQDVGAYYVDAEAERNASALMGGSSLASFHGRSVVESFASCALESCAQDQLSVPCNRSVTSLSRNSSTTDIFAAMEQFCPELHAEINPDIFGPGVSSAGPVVSTTELTNRPRSSFRMFCKSSSPPRSTFSSGYLPSGSATPKRRSKCKNPSASSVVSPASSP